MRASSPWVPTAMTSGSHISAGRDAKKIAGAVKILPGVERVEEVRSARPADRFEVPIGCCFSQRKPRMAEGAEVFSTTSAILCDLP